jgi:hypothetical protein
VLVLCQLGLASRQNPLDLARAVNVPVCLKLGANVMSLFDPKLAVDGPVQHILQRRPVQPLHPDHMGRRHDCSGSGAPARLAPLWQLHFVFEFCI